MDFGTAIAEVLVENCPKKLTRIGIEDSFGKSGSAQELLKYYKLTSNDLVSKIKEVLNKF